VQCHAKRGPAAGNEGERPAGSAKKGMAEQVVALGHIDIIDIIDILDIFVTALVGAGAETREYSFIDRVSIWYFANQ
jgi:hypothetical protein